METCGPYKIVKELGTGDGCTTFLARDGHVDLSVTVLTEGDAESFARSLELQERAAAVSPHVAPVSQRGACELGPWYSSCLYPLTFQKLLDGRVALSRPAIQKLLVAIVKGALALKSACGRPHGNLNPHTILLSGSGKTAEIDVALRHPADESACAPLELERRDLKAIGMTLYQVVRRREVEQESIILPLEASPEWKALFGKQTDAWLSLCNRLLDPNLSAQSYSLETLDRDLLALQPKPPVARQHLVAAAAVLVITAMVGAGVAWWKQRAAIEVSSNLPGATVKISGPVPRTMVASDKPVVVKAKKGSYVIEGTHGEFTARSEMLVSNGTHRVRLNFEYGTIHISAVAVDANGRTNQVYSTNLLVRPNVEVKHPVVVGDFLPLDVTARTGLWQTTNVMTLLQKAAASDVRFNIVSRPAKAMIEIFDDGRSVLSEQEPFTRALREGAYTVVARYHGSFLTNVMTLTRGTPLVDAKKLEFVFPVSKLTLFAVDGSANVPAKVLHQETNDLGATTDLGYWPLGRWTFRLEAPGYEATNVTFIVERANDPKSITQNMARTFGEVTVASDPGEGVRFATNRAELARGLGMIAPGTVKLLPGRHTLYGQHKDLGETNVTIDVPPRGKTNATLAYLYGRVEPRANITNVVVAFGTNTRPSGSVVMLPLGAHQLVATYSLTRPVLRLQSDVRVEAKHKNEPLVVPFTIEYGEVILTSSPLGASVDDEVGPLGELRERERETIRLMVPFGKRTYNFKGYVGGQLTNLVYSVMVTSREPTNIVANFNKPTNHIVKAKGMNMELAWIPSLGFYVGKYEVTQADYKALIGTTPSRSTNSSVHPVESVTWRAAKDFCAALNSLDAFPERHKHYRYELPTIEQWRAFAGSAFSNAALAVLKRDGGLARAGSKEANEYGLHDVRGNVWEWTADGKPVGSSYESPGLFTLIQGVPPGGEFSSSTIGFRVILAPPVSSLAAPGSLTNNPAAALAKPAGSL